MNILCDLSELLQSYATQFVIWAYYIRSIVSITTDNVYAKKLGAVVKLIIKMADMFWSEGYCYFLDYLHISYYPVTNRISGPTLGHDFPYVYHQTIKSFGNK